MKTWIPVVLLLGLVALVPPVGAAGPTAAGDPVASFDGRAGGLHLEAGEAVRLTASDIALAAELDPTRAVVELRETAGAEVVARLTPQVQPGVPPHGGRVFVLNAGERRLVRLGAAFNEEDLAGNDVLVEVVQGNGRLELRLVDLFNPGSVDETPSDTVGSQESAEALAGAAHRPRRRLESMRLSSLGLIDRAVAAGTLDGETAVVYRVYAIFTDARLPVQFRGDDTNVEGTVELDVARNALPTLSPANRALVQPFLVPPAYRGSWASPASAEATLDTPPPCQFFADTWNHVDTSNGFARVWWRQDATDAGLARTVADRIDNVIWPKITDIMGGHLPMPDTTEDCNGGSGRLDIYIVDQPRSFATRYRSCPGTTPAYILLGRASFPGTVAHEIFHTFQYNFPLAGCWSDKERYAWWGEASAEWIQDYVFPLENQEHAAAGQLLAEPEKPLDLWDETTQREYGAYLLPFFLHRKTGNTAFVRQAWENCSTQPALEAVDQALPGGFAAVWPQVALHDWNRTPVKSYETWDTLQHRARPAGGAQVDISLAGQQDAEVQLRVELPRLSATYKHFSFRDATARSVAFWNGATFNLSKQEIPVAGLQFVIDPASAAAIKGAKVQALIKIVGQDWQVEDWTEVPYRTFCRDMAAERLEELVVIISNSEFSDRERKLQPPGLAPVLGASNMGCWRWRGSARFTTPAELGDRTDNQSQAVWTRVQQATFPSAVHYQAEGSGSSQTTGNCTGSVAFTIDAAMSGLRIFNFAPAGSSSRRGYWGHGQSVVLYPVTCGQMQATAAVAAWIMFPGPPQPPDPPYFRVSADGTKMEGVYTSPDGFTSSWTFTAEREP